MEIISILLSLIMIGYFVVKKWRSVAFAFTAAFIIFVAMHLIAFDFPFVERLLSPVLGARNYENLVSVICSVEADIAIPYFGLMILTTVVLLIFTIKTTEKIVIYIHNIISDSSSKTKTVVHGESYLDKPVCYNNSKIYLVNCLILC